jgi:hypothetical protein
MAVVVSHAPVEPFVGEVKSAAPSFDRIEHRDRGVHDFGANAISGVKRNPMSFHATRMVIDSDGRAPQKS